MRQTRQTRHAQTSRCRTFPVGALVLSLALLAGMSAYAQSDVDSARVRLGLARQAAAAADEAIARNDGSAYQEQKKQAEDILREARQLFDKGKAGSSTDRDVLVDYAETLSLGFDYDLAADVLRRATRLFPKDAMLWLRLGAYLSHTGPLHAREAEVALQKSQKLKPPPDILVQAHVELGNVYYDEGLFDLSREQYDQALKLNAENKEARFARARLLVRDGRMKEAAEELNQLNWAPRDGVDRLKEALRDFELRRLFIPDTAEDHLAYAQVLLRANRLFDAAFPLERSLRLKSDDYTTWNLLGDVIAQVGNAKRAIEAYTRSLELNPDQPRTRESLDAVTQAAQQAARAAAEAVAGVDAAKPTEGQPNTPADTTVTPPQPLNGSPAQPPQTPGSTNPQPEQTAPSSQQPAP